MTRPRCPARACRQGLGMTMQPFIRTSFCWPSLARAPVNRRPCSVWLRGRRTRPELAPPEVVQDRRERSRLSQPLGNREESYSSAARQEKGNSRAGQVRLSS